MSQAKLESTGVLYVATGEHYRREFAGSLASLREWHPFLPVTLVTDKSSGIEGITEVILERPAFSFIDKIRGLANCLYDRTLFLDSDTFICGDLLELFEVLDRFEFGGAHSPGRICSGSCYGIVDVPDSFAQFNSGVLVLKNTAVVRKLIMAWLNLYERDVTFFRSLAPAEADLLKFPQDQPALREAMYKSEARIVTLSTEYNFRTIFPCYASRPVKILHGRGACLREISKEINSITGKRVFIPGRGVVTASI
jgi:hypothetical protein